jgi:class 3 adenylate cyclase
MMAEVTSDMRCPLPEHPVLRAYAQALEDAGHFGWIVDHQWRLVFMSYDLRRAWGDRAGRELAPIAIGKHFFSTEATMLLKQQRFGMNTGDLWRELFRGIGGLALTDMPDGRNGLLAAVDPSLHDIVGQLKPVEAPVIERHFEATGPVGIAVGSMMIMRVRDVKGELCGTVGVGKPAAGMSRLSGVTFGWDRGLMDRMEAVIIAGRRPAAILFADLEGSSALASTLSSATYFALGRRLVRAADRCVVDAGGLVGRHVGDGVVAFFPVETSSSESGAARACISAARNLRTALTDVAKKSGLSEDVLALRFGLHWGSTLYIGRVSTVARTEVTALGDEVNEAARIEACATGGRTLASKQLIERLDDDDAIALGVDPGQLTYVRLENIETATEKARRDAPAIAVCDL